MSAHRVITNLDSARWQRGEFRLAATSGRNCADNRAVSHYVYQPELDLTVCAWFEQSGFVSEVIRLRSFSPSSSASHPGRSASGFCRSTSVPDAAAPHYIL